jgi:hypothetical protein
MTKFASLIAAVAVVFPIALASIHQAAQIVA